MKNNFTLEIEEMLHIISKPWVQVVIVVLLISLVYLNALPNQFVLDDDTFLANWQLTHDLKNLPVFLTGALPFEHLGDYRPLKGIILSLNYALFGVNPIGYHLQALLIHLVSVLLAYL
ncbi:MAG: hypothetical protein AAB874_03450, partial [Patescibacteria group bacterium]